MAFHNKDYYHELGLTSDADLEAIKKAYRNLAKKVHPDRNQQPEAHDRFVAIAEAYAVLSDPVRKRVYDDQRRNNNQEALQRMAETFARAQELSRQRAEALYRQRQAELETKQKEEARWGRFAGLSGLIGLMFCLFFLTDYLGASWTSPEPIQQKRRVNGGTHYLLVTVSHQYLIEQFEGRGLNVGWQLQARRSFFFDFLLKLRVSPPYPDPQPAHRFLSTPPNLYRTFFFFPMLLTIFSLGALLTRWISLPMQRIQLTAGVWTWLSLTLLTVLMLV